MPPDELIEFDATSQIFDGPQQPWTRDNAHRRQAGSRERCPSRRVGPVDCVALAASFGQVGPQEGRSDE
jgi:hypothetical protein